MAKTHHKKVWPRIFRKGDLVLRKVLSLPNKDHNKWAPNYEGPDIVKQAFLE